MLDRKTCERARLARDARYDGRFFIGVITTGIYCRPVCPARQAKSENVRYFATAAEAAAAGFRPCRRCHPEAPPTAGTSTTVRRALKLMRSNHAGMDELAARLGMGSRHLRRLFRRHLGATPVVVAQNRRIQAARYLIRQTSLPMTEIALASGFGSIRRFNAVFRSVYRKTPTEFRRKDCKRELLLS